jgi:hypothetical protein
MVSYVLNVDKVGDLKFGRKKCRLHKKSEVVQVAKDYGIPTPNKKTVSELCGSLKKKIQEAERVSRQEVKKILANQNNIPLAKLYPEAAKKRFPDFFEVSEKVRRLREKRNEKAKKRAAAKKKALTPSMKAALKKQAVKKGINSFMKGMVTTNSNIKKLRELNEKPSKKAQPLTKGEARKRIKAMKGLSANNKFLFVNKLNLNQQSPRRVVRMAREMARLR